MHCCIQQVLNAEGIMKVELYNISKYFGDNTANDKVSFKINEGEVIALLGENGAGKSTLMKCLFGIYPPDEGSILINDREVVIESPRHAMNLGIGMVFQQFNLISSLSVLENLLLAYPKPPFWHLKASLNKSAVILRHLKELAPHINPETLVENLSVGERQLLELIKVLNLNAQVIILDEPTSVLTPQEAQRLWKMIRHLSSLGKSVVLITHKMEDVIACADRVMVMRAGKLVKSLNTGDCSESSLIRLMMGDNESRLAIKTPALDLTNQNSSYVIINNLYCNDAGQTIKNINLSLQSGEILGIAGVSGNGQRLLADALIGLIPLKKGELIIDGTTIHDAHQHSAPSEQISYIPEQPAVNAVAGDLSLTVNVAIGHFQHLNYFPDWKPELKITQSIIENYNIRPNQPHILAGQLSGGNLQKLVVGRELLGQKKLIIAAYPTMGLDASATHDIYQFLFNKAAEGASILWISEDLDDLMEYAHRIAVINKGEINSIFEPKNTDRYAIGQAMTGDKSIDKQKDGVTYG